MRTYRKVPQNLQGITPKWWWSDNSKGNQLEQTPSVFFAHWSSEKRIFSFQEGLDSSISKASKPSTSPSAEMHVHWMCVRVLGLEKSSSELEESLLSIRFCKEITRNLIKIERKRKTAEGWLNYKENLSRSYNRDSHLDLELVEEFDFQLMLHRVLASICKFCIEI